MSRVISFIPTALIALVFGFLGAWGFSFSGLGGSATRDWLIAHPEILPEIAEAYQKNQAKERLAGISDELHRPFPGAVLGNPNGKVTLVEFSDYGCTFCRQSVQDVKALIAANPDLRVVMREWPIFQGSDVAARMALAAANQGKYAAFHDAMFAHGPPTANSIRIAAEAAGLDMEAAREFGQSQAVEFELQKNAELARRLGFEGTPGWIAGSNVFAGALGRKALGDAVEDARKGT